MTKKTHYFGCWEAGPEHHECALTRIEVQQRELEKAAEQIKLLKTMDQMNVQRLQETHKLLMEAYKSIPKK